VKERRNDEGKVTTKTENTFLMINLVLVRMINFKISPHAMIELQCTCNLTIHFYREMHLVDSVEGVNG